MNRSRPSRTMTTIMGVVAMAVLLCAVVAVDVIGERRGGKDHAALFSCFALTIALSVFLPIRPDLMASAQAIRRHLDDLE